MLFPSQEVLPLVAFLDPTERKQARGMKVVYNGLARDEAAAEEIAHRSSFRHLWPREIQQRVERNWQQYGYDEP